MRTHLRWLLGLGLVAAASLLVPAGLAAQKGETEASAPADEDIRLHVVNHNWLDMKVYAIGPGGSRWRLGTVTGLTTQTFEIPDHLNAQIYDLQLLAVPIGARSAHTSPTILANPGDDLVWQLESNLAMSSLVIA